MGIVRIIECVVVLMRLNIEMNSGIYMYYLYRSNKTISNYRSKGMRYFKNVEKLILDIKGDVNVMILGI